MKTLVFVTVFVLSMNVMHAQEKPFVRTYDAIAKWDKRTDDWGIWKTVDLVISYNYKGTDKVALFTGDDTPVILIPVGKSVEKNVNSNGSKYQTMQYIDEQGVEVFLSLFDNGVLLLVYKDTALRFSPSDEAFSTDQPSYTSYY